MTTAYYSHLDATLRANGQTRPCLILDRDRLDRNIEQARTQARLPVRLVAKSLASLPLIDRAYEGLDAIGLMSFSAAMLETLLKTRPAYPHLMGKPLPTRAVAEVLKAQPNAATQVTWLVDGPERTHQLAELAAQLGKDLHVALEVDVGLHRGGATADEMGAQIATLTTLPGLNFAGIMGYEPHLAKLPAPFRRGAEQVVTRTLKAASGLGLVNTGGSLTFAQYGPDHGATELSLGSILLKPTDFDLPATQAFDPALFIAAPILKYLPGNPMPGPRWLSRLTGRARKADIALYGGYWKGKPVHPDGYQTSRIFGHSSNQEIWSGPPLPATPLDHFALLRPTQSEATLPEFGEILVLSEGEIIDRWPCLPVAQ